MQRRQFLQTMLTASTAALLNPRWAFARTPDRQRFVFILLRGGLDGLAAVVPFGDRYYTAQRASLAIDKTDLVQIDGDFGLAPGLAELSQFIDARELGIVPALAIPMRTRSHFDAQAVLETGFPTVRGSADGWMNRLVGLLGGEHVAVAVAAGLPRSLSGPNPVLTWSPSRLGVVDDDYLDRLHYLYQSDPALLDRFEAALQLRDIEAEGATQAKGRGQAKAILTATADLLTRNGGPNLAAVEFNGWDTHNNQGRAQGPLDRRLAQLAQGLVAFKQAMGGHWPDTNIVVLTEFGRTVRPNGSGGSDHGTAGVGFVLGTGLGRGPMHGDWPGLSDASLFENRDLRPIHDTRAVLQAVLKSRFDLSTSQLRAVFPEAGSLQPMPGLMA